jgi:anti-sigma regulatory factor (Ser/Thr protein kinase)
VAAPAEHRVEADAAALTHALWNLLDNAVKYSGDARTVWVSVKSDPKGTAISVWDEGVGIPRREQREIFRKFVRGEQARRLGVQGTGIGLAIVSHIVAAHGGRIDLQSEEGQGSRFTIVLPRGGAVARILIVEDEPDIVMSLEQDCGGRATRPAPPVTARPGCGSGGRRLGPDPARLMLPRMDGFDVAGNSGARA